MEGETASKVVYEVPLTRAKAGRVNRAFSRARKWVRRTGCSLGNSFAPDTPVLMADGTYLPIGAIEIGDYVATTDPGTSETYAEPVLDVIEGYGLKDLVETHTDLDPATPPLVATAGHPLWAVGKGWVKAEEVKPGFSLLSPDGSTHEITEVINRGEIPNQWVFNLNVGNSHTYTVAVSSRDVITHNSSCSHGRFYGPGKNFTERSKRLSASGRRLNRLLQP
ncbi:Hint domain-containing protein [Streptomyces luteogriseus]|uniref:Hint domain-containing protein n=1 Tax=Streptomyces luteogriseus TaxID=68233 RepID=UPI00263A091F|nr:Hint domain-containing protein [uncultured Streptomyces sp.]